MGAPPVLFASAGTLGEMNSRVCRWAREKVDVDTVNDAINDAIESLWIAASLASLSKFVGGPVTWEIDANTTEFNVVSIPDPTIYLQTGLTPGGALPARKQWFSYAYVTDSGSSTKLCPAIVAEADANTLFVVLPPAPVQQAIGWDLYAGQAGRAARVNVAPLSFNVNWTEPPTGIPPAPNGPWAPAFNTTADNISRILRIDATNQANTQTPWNQSDISSTVFSSMQARLPTVSTFCGRAYDLIDNRVLEIRPAGQYDISVTAYYVARPRRLRFPSSLLPFSSIAASQAYIFRQALSDVLLSLYEDESSESWAKRAAEVKQEIVLSINGENWNKNNRVRPFNAMGGGAR